MDKGILEMLALFFLWPWGT